MHLDDSRLSLSDMSLAAVQESTQTLDSTQRLSQAINVRPWQNEGRNLEVLSLFHVSCVKIAHMY